MTGDKNNDIVEEVFSRSMNADDRVSALFACLEHPPQDSLEIAEKSPSDLKESPAAKDIDSWGNKPFQSAKGDRHEFLPNRTIKKEELIHRVKIVVAAGLVVFILVFFGGSYLRQHGSGLITMMKGKQYANRSEIAGPVERQSVGNVGPESASAKINKSSAVLGRQDVVNSSSLSDEISAAVPETVPPGVPPESVPEKINTNSMSMALDWQPVIDWSSLLDEISATIPKTVQLNVIESGEAGEMFLEGEALSTDAVNNFVDALSTNRQVKSAELTEPGIGEGESQDMVTFSIVCSLVSDTKTPGSVDGDYDNSGLDRSRLFTPKEVEEFFGSIEPVSEHTGCTVKSLLISPKEAALEDEKTNGLIAKNHAALTLLGGYQNILKAVEKLQNRSQGVWFDSISIKQGGGNGQLECSMGISVYVAEEFESPPLHSAAR